MVICGRGRSGRGSWRRAGLGLASLLVGAALHAAVIRDVTSEDAHAGAVQVMVAEGVLRLDGEGRFRPWETPTRARLAEVLLRAWDLDRLEPLRAAAAGDPDRPVPPGIEGEGREAAALRRAHRLGLMLPREGSAVGGRPADRADGAVAASRFLELMERAGIEVPGPRPLRLEDLPADPSLAAAIQHVVDGRLLEPAAPAVFEGEAELGRTDLALMLWRVAHKVSARDPAVALPLLAGRAREVPAPPAHDARREAHWAPSKARLLRARDLLDAGEEDAARELLERVLRDQRTLVPGISPDIGLAIDAAQALVDLHREAGRLREVVEVLEDLLSVKRRVYLPVGLVSPDGSPAPVGRAEGDERTMRTVADLARAYEAVGEVDRALGLLAVSIEWAREDERIRSHPDGDRASRLGREEEAALLLRRGSWARAEEAFASLVARKEARPEEDTDAVARRIAPGWDREREFLPTPWGMLELRLGLAEALLAQGKLAAGGREFQAAALALQAHVGERGLSEPFLARFSRVSRKLAEVLLEAGKGEEAGQIAAVLVRFRRTLSGDVSRPLAGALRFQARIAEAAGRGLLAARADAEAARILGALEGMGGDPSWLGSGVARLGFSDALARGEEEIRGGAHERALPYLQRAQVVARRTPPGRSDLAALHHALGEVYAARDNPRGAARLFARAVKARRALGDRAGEATSLARFLAVRFSAGDHSPRVGAHRRMLELEEALHGPDAPATRAALSGLVTAVQRSGRPHDARPLLRELLGRTRKSRGTRSVEAWRVLDRLVTLNRVDLEDLPRADELARLLESLGQRIQGEDSRLRGEALLQRSKVLEDRGELDAAIETARRGLAMVRRYPSRLDVMDDLEEMRILNLELRAGKTFRWSQLLD